MKKEYSKLHERYTELFKSHMDYMERSKAMLGGERLEQMQMGAARNRIAGMSLNQLNRYVEELFGVLSFVVCPCPPWVCHIICKSSKVCIENSFMSMALILFFSQTFI